MIRSHVVASFQAGKKTMAENPLDSSITVVTSLQHTIGSVYGNHNDNMMPHAGTTVTLVVEHGKEDEALANRPSVESPNLTK